MENVIGPRNVSEIMNAPYFTLLLGTLVTGVIIFMINYFVRLGLLRFHRSPDSPKNEESSGTEENQETTVPQQNIKKARNKKRRNENQQKCAHSWLVGSLRGHTRNVLDLNFSTNGKFVATCAEDWLFSLVTVPAGHSSSRDARCYQAPVEHCRPSTEENVRDRFTCSNLVISKILARYILTPQQSSLMGYPMPVLSLGPNAGTVNYVPYPTGHNPADTSGPILDNCYATYNPVTNTYFSTSFKRIKCVRCFKIFFLTLSNKYMFKEEECVYHWGKYIEKIGQPDKKFWSCCGGEATNPGCERAKMHVWNGVMPGSNPLFNCMLTKKPETQPRDGFYGVYGLDTEMCYTRNGLEIVQIALVDMNGTVVYDTYVKPEAEVIDYNTRFSGVTASDLDGVEKTLKDVHKELASFIHADTILIGHGMENDLRALRLLHKHCIDTSVVFPHHYGLPYRNGLKYLAKRLLNRDIHVRSHDPAEDARTAVDLILLKLHSDYCEK